MYKCYSIVVSFSYNRTVNCQEVLNIEQMKPIIWILAGASLTKWFSAFCSDQKATIIFWDEKYNNFEEMLEKLSIFLPEESVIIFLSTHCSLKRDFEFAMLLKKKRYAVYCQSEYALQVGLDKLLSKELLCKNSLQTPELEVNFDTWTDDYLRVVKSRYGTAASDIRLYNHEPLREDFLVEKFYHGFEYSVNVFSAQNTHTAFPVVFKGNNSTQLIPPYQRTRFCLACKNELLDKLTNISIEIAKLLKNEGFLEVEFLITSDNTVYVIEVNPRVSGTLRMSSMSAGIKCFDLFTNKTYNKILSPIYEVLEIPCQQEITLKDSFSTSRISILFYDIEDLKKKLAVFLSDNEIRELVNQYWEYKRENLK